MKGKENIKKDNETSQYERANRVEMIPQHYTAYPILRKKLRN